MTIQLHPLDTPEAAAERADVAAGRLPERYGTPWQGPFLDRVAAGLHPGCRVLDVGSGARPTVPPEQRPEGCHYVGLDVSAHELDRAEAAAYDERVVGNISSPLPDLAGRFDLVISWQVLEHVPSMRGALATQHRALVPGGRMVAMLSGAWGFHALAARVVPYRISSAAQQRLLGFPAEDKFPTAYDGCSDRGLRKRLREGGWSSWEIAPLYKAGGYLRFARPLQRSYLVYEDWAHHHRRPNLATHYVVDAVA